MQAWPPPALDSRQRLGGWYGASAGRKRRCRHGGAITGGSALVGRTPEVPEGAPAVRLLLALIVALIGGGSWGMKLEFAESPARGVALAVSVYHASSWVALKAPWRQPCARDGGREDFGLSGCEPDGSEWNRGVRAL